jgi:ribose transport system substrate-binding protein
MIRHALRLALCLVVVALIAPGCKQGSASKTTIAVIPKGTTHVFWKSVEAGAVKAGKELGVEIIWKGPLKEDDKTQQIGIVEQFVAEGVSGICLAPLDDTALLAPVQAATQKKVPVVIFDSGLKGQVGKDFVSYVATDNRKGGQMGGEELARLLGGKGKVVLLRYKEGHGSTGEREEGFLEAVRKHPGIEVIQENRYGGATAGEAQKAAETLVDKLREADGIFCPNESSTQGMLSALRGLGLTGQKKFVGFDTSPPLVEGLRNAEIHALVAQDPTRMGYEAVSTMVKHLRGEKVPDYTDTGARLVTREKLEDPEIRKLIGG